jgi:hypothetical protein
MLGHLMLVEGCLVHYKLLCPKLRTRLVLPAHAAIEHASSEHCDEAEFSKQKSSGGIAPRVNTFPRYAA